MDVSAESAIPRKNRSPTVGVRLSRSTARQIRAAVAKINKQPHGRPIKADAVVRYALDRLTENDLHRLKESTYSAQDRIEIEYRRYCKESNAISKSEFLERLLEAGLPSIAGPSSLDSEVEKSPDGKSSQHLNPD